MLLQLITRARRRLLGNALAVEAARSAIVAATLLIVLLVLGTDILSWRWLIAMPAAALAAGAFLALRHLPGVYRTARIIDTRLHLSDTLATALFCCGSESERRFDADMRRAHRERAEATAREVRVSDAVPFRTPRLLYAAVPLALLAGSLFVLRYVWQDRLDLRQPLPVAERYLLRLSKMDLFAFGARKEPPPRHESSDREEGKEDADHSPRGDRSPHASPDNQASRSQDKPDGESKSSSAPREAGTQPNQQTSDSRQNSPEEGQQQQEGTSGQQARQDGSSSSLMSKLSDAVRGMLSRLGGEPSAARSGQSSRSSDSARQGASRTDQRQGSQSAAQQSGAEAKGDGQKADSRQGEQGQSSSASASATQGNTPDKQPGSNAGSDDGAKDIKQAEQIAAMGKISVILGKRSETVSGNATLETVSGKQSLVTPYTNAQDAHTQSHIAINRDEVPVTLEDYVQRYFVAVRSRAPRAPASNTK